jgi:hypothetical protein
MTGRVCHLSSLNCFSSVQFSKFAAGPRQLLIPTWRRGHCDTEGGRPRARLPNAGWDPSIAPLQYPPGAGATVTEKVAAPGRDSSTQGETPPLHLCNTHLAQGPPRSRRRAPLGETPPLELTEQNLCVRNWKDHISRMSSDRILKEVLKHHPKGKTSLGSPLKQWKNSVL